MSISKFTIRSSRLVTDEMVMKINYKIHENLRFKVRELFQNVTEFCAYNFDVPNLALTML